MAIMPSLNQYMGTIKMGKYDSTATATTDSNNGARGSREKAVAWANFTFRLKDGASTQMGMPFMMSDYVQRTIIEAMKKQADDQARKDLLKRLICKAIDNGDFDFRFVMERDESAVGELDL